MSGKVIIKIDGDDNGLRQKLSGVGKMAKTAIATAAGAVSGLAVGFAKAVQVGANFEHQMSTVQSISNASAEEIGKLTEKAKEMGIISVFSATEAGKAMEYMAMAGWKTEDMLSGVEGVMNLAAASGEDLGLTADIVTDSMTAFGLSADKSAHFADVLAKASSSSNTNVSLLGETFKYIAPVAGALGYSIEDTSVAIGLMANAGIKGSQAGTTLRATLSRMTKPTDEVESAMKKLGISMTDSSGKMKPLSMLIGDMRSAFSKLTTEQKAQYAATLGGQEAMSGLLAIVNASESDFQTLTREVNNSSGAAQKMSEVKLDNLKGQVTLLKSSFEGVGIAVQDKFAKPMKKGVTSAIISVNSFARSLSQGGLGVALSKLGSAVGNLIADFARFSAKALPPTIKGVTWLVDNFGILARVTASAVMAFEAFMIIKKVSATVMGLVKAFQLANLQVGLYAVQVGASTLANTADLGVLTAKEIVVGVLTGKIGLATAAQHLWNAALAANPAGIVVAAIGALAVGIGVLIATTNKKTEDEKKFQEALDETTKKANEVTEAVKQQKEAYESSVESITQSAEAKLLELERTKSLADELTTLVDSQGNVADADKKRAEFILGELNTAYGTEYKLVDLQAGKLKDLQEEIYRTIEAEKQKAVAAAYYDVMNEAIKNEIKAKKNAEKATKEFGKAQQEQNFIIEKVRAEMEKVRGATVSYEEAVSALEKGNYDYIYQNREYKQALKGVSEQYHQNKEDLNNLNQAILEYGNASAEVSRAELEYETAKTNQLKGIHNDLTNNFRINAESRIAINSNELEQINKAIENNSNAIIALEQGKAAAVTEEQRKAYDLQLEMLHESNTALNNAKITANNVAISLEEQKNNSITSSLVNALERDLQAVQGNKDQEKIVLQNHYKEALKQLELYGNEYEKGTEGYSKEGYEALKQYVGLMEQKYGSGMGSIVDETSGMAGDVSSIIEASKPKVSGKMGDMAQESGKKWKAGIDGNSLGKNTAAGIVSGLAAKMKEVASMAAQLATAAHRGYAQADKQNSPSKIMRNKGRFTGDGAVLGLKDKIKDAKKAAGDLASATHTAFDDVMLNIPEKFAGVANTDFKWVVKSVNEQIKDASFHVNSILSKVMPLSASVSSRGGHTTNQYVTNDNGVTQNFYSQTVSPYDAYRRAVLHAYN